MEVGIVFEKENNVDNCKKNLIDDTEGEKEFKI